MCGVRSTRSPRDPSRSQADAELFARVLREVFYDERWEDVESSARRAWRHVGQITGQDWEEVQDSIRNAWQTH
jgi:hypothetical protein